MDATRESWKIINNVAVIGRVRNFGSDLARSQLYFNFHFFEIEITDDCLGAKHVPGFHKKFLSREKNFNYDHGQSAN